MVTNSISSKHADFEDQLRSSQVPVLGYLVRLTGNIHDARDILQGANLTAWEKREDFEDGSSFVSWLRTIARNHYLNSLRSGNRRFMQPLLDEDLERLVEARTGEREAEKQRQRRVLQLCVGELPETQRGVVQSFYMDGESLQTIATKHKRKRNAIGQLLHRARQNLLACTKKRALSEARWDL